MLFTVGKDREYERLMLVQPSFDRPVLTEKERECPYCLYYNESSKKCSLERCVVFED